MANYVNKDILCQAYIHIEPTNMTEAALSEFNKTISIFIEQRGKFFINKDVDTAVELKDGSLKVYATVLGSIYAVISAYGSFRSGVDYLSSDIKRLSDTVVSECLFQSKCRHDDVIHLEARVGVIGQLKNITDEIKVINTVMQSKPLDQVIARLDRLESEISRMEKNLHAPNDIPYVRQNLLEMIEELIPAIPHKVPKHPFSSETREQYLISRRRLTSRLKSPTV